MTEKEFKKLGDYDILNMSSAIAAIYKARRHYHKYLSIIDDNFKKFWRKKRGKENCQRIGCKIKRSDSNKWLKCSECLVATYCSKKCAKYDWKYGNHKEHCPKYVQMIKN